MLVVGLVVNFTFSYLSHFLRDKITQYMTKLLFVLCCLCFRDMQRIGFPISFPYNALVTPARDLILTQLSENRKRDQPLANMQDRFAFLSFFSNANRALFPQLCGFFSTILIKLKSG